MTVTLLNGLGGATDWLTVAPSNAPNTTFGDWTYVGAGVTTGTWTAAMPATLGTYQFRLFADDGFARLATTLTINVSGVAGPTLMVNKTTAAPGESVTVTLANGTTGSPGAWLALSRSGELEGLYSDFTNVGAGVTTGTWTPAMPTTPGTYEFRLYEADGLTRVATSPAITVVAAGLP